MSELISLPLEIICYIFDKTNVKTLLTFSQCSHLCNNLIKDLYARDLEFFNPPTRFGCLRNIKLIPKFSFNNTLRGTIAINSIEDACRFLSSNIEIANIVVNSKPFDANIGDGNKGETEKLVGPRYIGKCKDILNLLNGSGKTLFVTVIVRDPDNNKRFPVRFIIDNHVCSLLGGDNNANRKYYLPFFEFQCIGSKQVFHNGYKNVKPGLTSIHNLALLILCHTLDASTYIPFFGDVCDKKIKELISLYLSEYIIDGKDWMSFAATFIPPKSFYSSPELPVSRYTGRSNNIDIIASDATKIIKYLSPNKFGF